MKRATVGRFTLLGTLYFAQGLPFGFFVQALPVLMRKAGYSLSTIGFTTLLTLPWALKFLWAPHVDRWYSPRLGRRRTWILAMQLASVIVLGGIALAPGSEKLEVLLAASFVANLIAATQDIATDGLAVELLPREERGFANGLQVAAYRVGMVAGGGVLLGVYDEIGHHEVFAAMAALTLASTLPVLASREPRTVAVRSADAQRGPAVDAPHFLALPGAWRVIALVAVYKFGEASAQNLIRLFLTDRGMSLGDIARLLGNVGFIAGMAGALTGGALVGRLGRRRALIVFGLGQVIAVGGYAYLAYGAPSIDALYACAAFELFTSGMATAALFTAMMDWSRPATAGTDYTVMASTVVIATGLAGIIGGISAQMIGYGPHFLGSMGLCLFAVVVVVRLFPAQQFPAPNAR